MSDTIELRKLTQEEFDELFEKNDPERGGASMRPDIGVDVWRAYRDGEYIPGTHSIFGAGQCGSNLRRVLGITEDPPGSLKED